MRRRHPWIAVRCESVGPSLRKGSFTGRGHGPWRCWVRRNEVFKIVKDYWTA